MLPRGWTNVLLDDVAQRKSGHTPNKEIAAYWNGGIKWVSLADSGRLDKGLIHQTDKEISKEGIRKSSAVLLSAGTVVLSRDAGVGKSGVLASPMAVSQHFIAWDCTKSLELQNWYLYYWLQASKPDFERIANGSAIKTIGLAYFKKLKLNAPPIAEQRRIAEVLSAWDEAITVTARLLANSRRQKRALLVRLVSDSSTWETVRLESVATRVKRKSDGGDHPVLMISASSGFVLQSDMYSRFMAGKSFDSYVLLNQDEFAYNKGNSKSYEFGCIYSLENFPQGLVPHVYVCFSMDKSRCFRPFYKYLFESDFLHDQLGALVNTGVRNNGLLNIRPSDFFGTHVPVPPMEDQQRIALIIDAMSSSIRKIEESLSKLRIEKAALMQQLLTGKRRVSLPQPAEVEPA